MPGQIPRIIRAAVHGGLVGQHMHHCRIRGRPLLGGRAIVATAQARHVRLEAGHRAHRIGAALFAGAGVVWADGVGDGIKALIQRDPVSGVDVGPYRGHARGARLDLHEPAVVDRGRDPYPVGVEFGDPLIHPVA